MIRSSKIYVGKYAEQLYDKLLAIDNVFYYSIVAKESIFDLPFWFIDSEGIVRADNSLNLFNSHVFEEILVEDVLKMKDKLNFKWYNDTEKMAYKTGRNEGFVLRFNNISSKIVLESCDFSNMFFPPEFLIVSKLRDHLFSVYGDGWEDLNLTNLYVNSKGEETSVVPDDSASSLLLLNNNGVIFFNGFYNKVEQDVICLPNDQELIYEDMISWKSSNVEF